MRHESFDYELVLADDKTTATSIVAYQYPAGAGLRGVLWSASKRVWISAPAIVSDLFQDEPDSPPTRTVDRAVAEQIARDVLQTELPSEAALTELCDEGERMGWRFGPPADR